MFVAHTFVTLWQWVYCVCMCVASPMNIFVWCVRGALGKYLMARMFNASAAVIETRTRCEMWVDDIGIGERARCVCVYVFCFRLCIRACWFFLYHFVFVGICWWVACEPLVLLCCCWCESTQCYARRAGLGKHLDVCMRYKAHLTCFQKLV